MNSKRGEHKEWFKGLVLGLMVAVMVAIGVRFYLGHRELQEKEREIAKLEEEIIQLEEEKGNLRGEIERVHSEEFIEQRAREKLGLVKEGELLYIIVDKKSDEEQEER